ncbi:MAG: hypothetical protein ABIK75_07040 [candidate division WOR-3 bacterium]
MAKMFLKDKATESVVKTAWSEPEFKAGDLLLKFPHNNQIIEVLIPEIELKYYCLKLKEKEAI